MSAFLYIALLAAVPGRAGEIETSLQAGHGAWLQGRPEEAESHYGYVLNLAPDHLEAAVNRALVLRDLGRVKDSLPLWVKATLLDPLDPTLRLGLGWAHLSLEEFDEAEAAFEEALKVSSTSVHRSEGFLGLAMSSLEQRSSKQAVERLQQAFVANPYWLGGESYLLGLAKAKDRRSAIVHHNEALEQDGKVYEALLELARIYEKVGDPISTYKAYQSLSSLAPDDALLKERTEKARKFLKVDPEALAEVWRGAWPLMKTPKAFGPTSGPRLRVALFADPFGRPAELGSFKFIANSDFKIIDERLGTTATGKAQSQWELSYSRERDLLELRDNQGVLRHATKQPVTLEPLTEGGTFLVKAAASSDWHGADPSDRDVRGSLRVARLGAGFTLVDELGLEPYLASALSIAMPEKAPAESHKAAAVALRTEALALAAQRHPGKSYALCDSRHCLPYRGLASETAAAEGVRSTVGQTLKGRASSHGACGGRTEAGAQDSPSAPWTVGSPWELERRVRESPPPDLYDREASLVVAHSSVRWLRALDVAELDRRNASKLGTGALRVFTPLARTPSGRLRAVRWTGADQAKELGVGELDEALSPGSLRSRLLSAWPLYDGKRPKWLMVWGVGTGDGEGLCRAGAAGLASLGKNYKEILAHYFPGSELVVPAAPQGPTK